MRIATPAPLVALPLALAAVLAACGDSTAPGPPSRLTLSVAAPAGDSLAQLGVDVVVALRDSMPIAEIAVYVDSAAAPVPAASAFTVYVPARRWERRAVAFAPGPGRHTITVAVVDTAGGRASASVTRAFRIPEVAYEVAALPDQGNGANALHVNAAGDVVGWVGDGDRVQRPARWRGGALTVLPVAGGVSARAVRSNAAGDVLLQVSGSAQTYHRSAGIQIMRHDGVVFAPGPVRMTFGRYPTDPYAYVDCCTVAGDLTDGRVALGASTGGVAFGGASFDWSGLYRASVRFDVTTGQVLDSVSGAYQHLNEAGQMAGAFLFGSGDATIRANVSGFVMPALPDGPRRFCGRRGENGSVDVVALDDSANLLVGLDPCPTYAYLSPAGGVLLDRFLGPSVAARMAPRGGLVVALDRAGAVYVWRAASRSAARVRLPGDAWRVDSLGSVNAAGAIAAHGVNAATGRAAALLLTPSR